jgi:hypothetical protein
MLARNYPMDLEKPTYVPNFERIKASYEKSGISGECLVLQGHPNKWDDQRFDEFAKIVRYFKQAGCAFMTVSEFCNRDAKQPFRPGATNADLSSGQRFGNK